MRCYLSIIAAILTAATAASQSTGLQIRGTTQAGGRPEPNAVVWLEAPSGAAPVKSARVVLDQRNIDFWPHVLAVQVGTTVDFPNNDRVFHNVFSFYNGDRFDLGLYPVGTVKRVTFHRPGLSRVFCNIHPNMAAYIMVIDSPHFSVSNTSGAFVLPNITAGSYKYHAWRPGRPELTGQAVLGAGTSFDLQWP